MEHQYVNQFGPKEGLIIFFDILKLPQADIGKVFSRVPNIRMDRG
jgi:hypothetical protein